MAKIATTGQLRQFLADTLLAVRDGKMDTDKARNITKLAAQINESIYSEIKTARIMEDLGREVAGLGELKVGGNEKEEMQT